MKNLNQIIASALTIIAFPLVAMAPMGAEESTHSETELTIIEKKSQETGELCQEEKTYKRDDDLSEQIVTETVSLNINNNTKETETTVSCVENNVDPPSEETMVSQEDVSDSPAPPEETTITEKMYVSTEPLPDLSGINENIVWVGDSRTVGLASAVGLGDDQVVAEVGVGLKWLKDHSNDFLSTKNSTVVFNFGVNDLHNAKKYVDFFSELPQDFVESNDIVIMSVNPVDEEKERTHGYSVKNSEIDSFNDVIKDGIQDNIIYLDTNSHLKQIGFDTTDGLHYNDTTYEEIYSAVTENKYNRRPFL